MKKEYLNIEGISRKNNKDIDMSKLNRDIGWKIDSASKHKQLAEKYTFDRIRGICPICNEKKGNIFVNIYGYEYVECNNCGHIYLNSMIKKDDVRELYLGNENKNLQHIVYLSEELFNKRISQITDPKVQWILEETKNNGLWIDIGCGTGEILFSAKKKGCDVRGVDSDEKEIEFATSKGLNVFCDYITADNAYKYINDGDIISLFNVLEHLENPKELIKNISDNIEEGTYVILEVPRHPSISSFNNLIFNEVACRHIYPPDHMHIFTEQSMAKMVKEANLEPISIWNFGQDAYDFIITALASRNIKPSKFTDRILESVPLLQKGIDESGLSDTMIIICKKI